MRHSSVGGSSIGPNGTSAGIIGNPGQQSSQSNLQNTNGQGAPAIQGMGGVLMDSNQIRPSELRS